MTDPNPYREVPVPTEGAAEPTYVAAWRRYRRLGALSSPIVLIPGLLLTPVIHHLLGGDAGFAGVVSMIFFVLWFFAFITVRRRLLSFRCPRCGRRFRSFDTTEFDWCAHCHLRRFALFDPDARGDLK